MAGTIQAAQVPNDNGIAPLFFGPAAQNELPNLRATLLHVKATGALNITIKNQLIIDGQPGPDKVIVMANGQERIIGPFPKGVYTLQDGNVQINFDTPANCTIAVYDVAPV